MIFQSTMHRRNKASTKLKKEKASSPHTAAKETDDSSMNRFAVLGMMLVLGLLSVVAVSTLRSDGNNIGGNVGRELRNIRGVADTTNTDVEVITEKSSTNVEKEESQEGKLIRFTVSNLDGEEGRIGTFLVRTHPSWGPLGAERLEALVTSSFWTDCRFFRVIPNFVAQFGINGKPTVQKAWRGQVLADDPVVTSNTRGTITFATSGKNTRTTQLFINFVDNKRLDNQGFTPIAEVLGDGMTIVDRIYKGYEGNPNQGKIQNKGNVYLESAFPKLTFISKAEFVENEEESNLENEGGET